MRNAVMNKLKINYVVSVLLLCAVIFVCTGCAENVEEDRLVSVNFEICEDSSRGGFSVDYIEQYNPDLMYWRYTAVKTSGIHSTGASEKDRLGNLIETPVSEVAGINGYIRQFSAGTWTFTIYGYADEAYTELVYKTEKAGVSLTSGSLTLVFEKLDFAASSVGGVVSDKGTLEIGALSVLIPTGGTAVTADSVITVELYNGDTLIAESRTVPDGDVAVGKTVTVNPLVFKEGKNVFPAGIVTTVRANVRCENFPKSSSGVYETSVIGVFPLTFFSKAGVVTKISGILGDWPLKPVGGTIFYVDTTTGAGAGATYKFYDKTGKELTTISVAGLSTAVAYTISGTPAKDKFYVYNKDLVGKSLVSFVAISATSSSYYRRPDVYTDKVDSNHLVYRNMSYYTSGQVISGTPLTVVGEGKTNTEFFMNLNHYYPAGTTTKDTGVDSANYADNERTVWWYLKNKVNNSNAGVNNTGVYDWYVPSCGEMEQLRIYDGGTMFVVASGATCYRTSTLGSFGTKGTTWGIANSCNAALYLDSGSSSLKGKMCWVGGHNGYDNCMFIRSF